MKPCILIILGKTAAGILKTIALILSQVHTVQEVVIILQWLLGNWLIIIHKPMTWPKNDLIPSHTDNCHMEQLKHEVG